MPSVGNDQQQQQQQPPPPQQQQQQQQQATSAASSAQDSAHRYQHPNHQQRRFSITQQPPQQQLYYGYQPTSPIGSPTASPLGYVSSLQASPTVSPLGNMALVNAQIIHSTPGYYYTGHGGSPVGSPPPMATLAATASPTLAPGHFITPIPMNTRDSGAQQFGSPQFVASPPTLSMSPTMLYQHVTSQGDDLHNPRNVYVRNLPEDCSDEALEEMSTMYGEIETHKSIIDASTGKCKGYGFILYKTVEMANRAIEGLNARGYQASPARDSLKTKLKRLQDKKSGNVYISNLPVTMDEEGLKELIKPDTVISAKILRDSNSNIPRGAGFARMADRETALRVIERLKGQRLPNTPGPLMPRIADSDGQKQLKKQINSETTSLLLRSGATSPVMWTPGMVMYQSAGQSANVSATASALDVQRQLSPSPTPFVNSPQQSFSGIYQPAFQGYASPGYVSPLNFGSPTGYASPTGYGSPGYVSPVQMPSSPQPVYPHLPEQPSIPTRNGKEAEATSSMQNGITPQHTGGEQRHGRRHSQNHHGYNPRQPPSHQQHQQLVDSVQSNLHI